MGNTDIRVNKRILSAIRTEYNLTQKEVAERLDISNNYISMVNTGRAGVSIALYSRILEAFPRCREEVMQLYKQPGYEENSENSVVLDTVATTEGDEAEPQADAAATAATDSEEVKTLQAENERLEMENQQLLNLWRETQKEVVALKAENRDLQARCGDQQ